MNDDKISVAHIHQRPIRTENVSSQQTIRGELHTSDCEFSQRKRDRGKSNQKKIETNVDISVR